MSDTRQAPPKSSDAATPSNPILAQLDDHLALHFLQNEKMAALGQLAAGVAHEINNPIGYVFSNLKTLADYLNDMLKIIDAVDHVSTLEDLRQLKVSLDYDYIRQDVADLIRESGEGVERITQIIAALKYFSHDEGDGFRNADLHQSIDSTLTVANNEIKYKASVVKAFGNLPRIDFNVSQINQVILNLLVNAVQALPDHGTITVRTAHDAPWVWFEVEDDGCGMTPEQIKRIFEPFYTTKPVGQGTGLGLALSYNIIDKHRGRIEVFSTPGKGTRFRVWLPEHQPQLLPKTSGNSPL